MRYIILIAACWLTFGLASCSDDPAPPQFRVKNERATKASLQVQTSNGNTININNVDAGTTSAYQGVAAGVVDVTVQITGETGDFTASFTAINDQTFTIVVANTTPPTINIVSP